MIRLRLSLAQKCQILFGLAVVLILVASLAVPWLRMQRLVEEGQRQAARRLAEAWLEDLVHFGQPMAWRPDSIHDPSFDKPLRITLIEPEVLDFVCETDPFVAEARLQLETFSSQIDAFGAEQDPSGEWVYRYARAVRQRDLERSRGGFSPEVSLTQVADPLRALLLIEMRAEWAQTQLRLNQLYLGVAGLLAGILAIGVFWYITTRLVLSPVHVLRDTAQKVAEGDLNIRSNIHTGDEFEQLAVTFNQMLANLKLNQDKLRELNQQLDLKIGELAESNTSLFEANRLKGDFLASVSHELRTPLNSIIGFAELLSESFGEAPDSEKQKLRRYAENILNSSRSLLRMITELLDLAKIEAGRMELHVDTMSAPEVCQSLLNLMRPQADRKKVELAFVNRKNIPAVQTDPGKFQQIVFNLLSNAIKFTPEGGRVELGVEAVTEGENPAPQQVRIWVADTGPGIPVEMHSVIFEKFRQLDDAHTREHGGSGLGLAICQELARLLQARIRLDSDVGRGSTFSLTLPLAISDQAAPLMPQTASRG